MPDADMKKNPSLESLQKKILKLEQEAAKNRELENQFKESEKTYRHIFEHSPVMVYRSNYRGYILDINKAGVHILGYKNRKEIIGMEASRFLYANPDDRRRFQKNINKTGFLRDFETRFRRKDGKIIDVQVTSTARRGKKGKIEGYEGFILDITRRKQAERALLESEKKYRTVAESSLTGIFIHQKKRYCYVNRRLAEMLGYDSPEEIIGKSFWTIVHPDSRPLVKERGLRRENADFLPDHYSFRAIKKDGSSLWCELRATRSTYLGEPAVIGNFIDITQSKIAEEEIRQLSRRIIQAGEKERKRIAADLHDEFGQTLTSLHFDLEAMQKSLPAAFIKEKGKCAGLISKVENLADVLRKTISHLRPDLLDHIGLISALEWYIKEFNQQRPEIKINFQTVGFKKRLSQEIETALYRIGTECLANIKKHANATAVDIILTYSYPWAIFVIRDNGRGYRTTTEGLPLRNTSRGIGLMSMMERAASLHGKIDISSAPRRGTTIRGEIPLL